MIPMSPMFEGMFSTAKNYWLGKKPEAPSVGGNDVREKIVNAAKKVVGKDEGGVGGTLRKVLNRRSMLAQAASND